MRQNQLQELRRYVEARQWTAVQFVDQGISGSKDKRPALDVMLRECKRRKVDVVVCWRLDRLRRNLRHLIMLVDQLAGLGVSFVSLSEGIDATTPAGRLQLHVLAAIAEFERSRLRERVMAGLARARAAGVGWADHAEKSTLNVSLQSQGCRRERRLEGSECLVQRCRGFAPTLRSRLRAGVTSRR